MTILIIPNYSIWSPLSSSQAGVFCHDGVVISKRHIRPWAHPVNKMETGFQGITGDIYQVLFSLADLPVDFHPQQPDPTDWLFWSASKISGCCSIITWFWLHESLLLIILRRERWGRGDGFWNKSLQSLLQTGPLSPLTSITSPLCHLWHPLRPNMHLYLWYILNFTNEYTLPCCEVFYFWKGFQKLFIYRLYTDYIHNVNIYKVEKRAKLCLQEDQCTFLRDCGRNTETILYL